LCLGDNEAARRYLTEAMERRAAMGDHAAASITRHNLDRLFPPVPFTPPDPSGQSVSTTVSRRVNPGSITGWLKFLGSASLAGLGGWFFWPEAKPQFTPERLSFLNQPLNQQSAQRTVTLTNPGAKELAIDEMRIDGAAASDLTIVSDDCRGKKTGARRKMQRQHGLHAARRGRARSQFEAHRTSCRSIAGVDSERRGHIKTYAFSYIDVSFANGWGLTSSGAYIAGGPTKSAQFRQGRVGQECRSIRHAHQHRRRAAENRRRIL